MLHAQKGLPGSPAHVLALADLPLGSEGPAGLAMQGWDCRPSGQLTMSLWTRSHLGARTRRTTSSGRFTDLGATEAVHRLDSQILVRERDPLGGEMQATFQLPGRCGGEPTPRFLMVLWGS